ncbi:MAG: hypothetical protein KAV87_15655 [Desulfobacteraceae bacterium]|nr:hypothetical protein [Desulfobacteraceae bacterium]
MKPSVSVELALVNGKIVTLNQRDEIAQAVAVCDGKIVSVGSTKRVLELAGKDTTVIDLQGKPSRLDLWKATVTRLSPVQCSALR